MAVGPVGPKSGFDKLSQNLEKASESLKDSAKGLGNKARRNVDAFAKQLDDAGADALGSTAKHTETLAARVAGWSSDAVPEGGRYAARGVGHGLSSIAGATRLVADARVSTVRTLQRDPNAVRFSQETFGKAGQRLQSTHEAMTVAWSSYVESVRHLSGSAAGVAPAAAHVAAVGNSLAKAAALTTSPSATKLAEYGARLTNAAVLAADSGAPGARQLVVLGAQLDAASAAVLANPDAAQAQAQVKAQLAVTQSALAALVKAHPGLTGALERLLA